MTTPHVDVPDREREFVDTIPEFYDRHLGPRFFAPHAREIARRVAVPTTPGAALLEIAAARASSPKRCVELGRHCGDAPLRAPMLARFVSARKAETGRLVTFRRPLP